MSLDKMALDKMALDKMTVDEMSLCNTTLYKMIIQLNVGRQNDIHQNGSL